MTSQYRHRRTSSPSTVFPNPLEPGEIAVNTANRQIAVGDAQTGVIGAPLPLLVIRYFDTRAIYAFNDMVVIGGNIQRALVANGPGGFNQTQWTPIAGVLDPRYVAKAGDTMTGPLVLPGDPVNPLEATDKHYVDTALANKSSVIVSDTPPVGVIDNTLWFESDTGFTYLMFNDGTSRQWVLQAGPPPDTSQFVQRTGDTMSGKLIAPSLQAGTLATASYSTPLSIDASVLNLQSLSGGIVTAPTMPAGNNTSAVANTTFVQNAITTYAAPMDAMAYSGMQINGSMEVSQEKGATETVGAAYVIDGWRTDCVGSSGSIGTSQLGGISGFSNRIAIRVITAQPSLGAGDLFMLSNLIEGYRIARLGWGTANAQPITIAFWTGHTKTGVYSVSVRSSSRTYAMTYIQNASGVWQYNTLTVPGDVAGTWAATNVTGIYLTFTLACGTTYTAPSANGWLAGSYLAALGQVNALDSTSNTFNLTGVVVLPGIEAPSAARSPLIMRPYDQELVTCMRYYERAGSHSISWSGYMIAGNIFEAGTAFKVVKRAVPTLTFPGAVSGGNFGTIPSTNTTIYSVVGSPVANITGSYGYWYSDWIADARL